MFHLGPNMRLALAVLATWRITHLLVSEDGPGDLIFHLRAKLGASFAGKLMDCFYCLSLWVSAVTAIAVTHRFADWVLVWLALSGAASLLERWKPDETLEKNYTKENENDYALLRTEESGTADFGDRSFQERHFQESAVSSHG